MTTFLRFRWLVHAGSCRVLLFFCLIGYVFSVSKRTSDSISRLRFLFCVASKGRVANSESGRPLTGTVKARSDGVLNEDSVFLIAALPPNPEGGVSGGGRRNSAS